jgi:signal transduction histidine kinase
MSEARSGYIAFRPRARLLKLIGSELISDEVVAVTELVKNAHDADASTALVVFRGASGPDGEIHIIDDGCGMDRETFLGGWMEPAGSTKRDVDGRLTRRGRRVLGEKGVGRFAADKLGRELELVSRTEGHDAEVRAIFDWDLFDSDGQMLSEIRNRWELRPAAEIDGHGTILRIRRLRERWTERMFRRLSTRLSRLQSPFGSRHGFSIRIETDEFPEYSGELQSTFLAKSPYSLELTFNGKDSFRIQVGDKHRTVPAGKGVGRLGCGPVRVRLHAFDLETEALARIGPRMEVRAWLREWSGVSVYRDGFRIWPYGEPHDDWLRLDQRRVNNPVVRVSNNQVVGFVEISGNGNPELLDQTNREGLIHNEAFEDLRRTIEHAFQRLEEERQRIRHPASSTRSERRRGKRLELPIADTLEQLATLGNRKTRRDLRKLASEARENLQRQHDDTRRLIEAYNDLAAAGQVASSIGPALGEALAQIQRNAGTLGSHLRGRRDRAAVTRIRSSMLRMSELLTLLGGPGTAPGRRGRTVDVVGEVASFRRAVLPALECKGVSMAVTSDGPAMQRADMHPLSFRRVLHLLLSNSLDWLIQAENPRIAVHSRVVGDWCEVSFSDNGRGIDRVVASRIFEPMFTQKEGGQGMGLTIARGLAEQHGGSLDVVLDGRRRGAMFRIRLPRKRSRATVA